jgi:hypothetical protein
MLVKKEDPLTEGYYLKIWIPFKKKKNNNNKNNPLQEVTS